MVFTIVTIIFLPMSFLAAFFAIPIKDFPRDNGNTSIPLEYVSKIVFGVGFAVSIPLITIAFAVDNVGLLIRRAIRSLTTWRSHPQKRLVRRGRSNSISPDEKNDMKDLRGARRSGETNRRGSTGSGFKTDSDIGMSPMRSIVQRVDKDWKDEPEWRGRLSGGSRDLERGFDRSG